MGILASKTPAVHDDVIKWNHFPRYWPFVRGIHRSPVDSPHKGQWRGALMFSLICTRIKCRVNNVEAGDMRRHHVHYDVNVMSTRPVTRRFDVFFDLCLNKRLSKQWRRWWFDTPSRSLWRHGTAQTYKTRRYELSVHEVSQVISTRPENHLIGVIALAVHILYR